MKVYINLAALTEAQRSGFACCLTGRTDSPMIPLDIETPESVSLFVCIDALMELGEEVTQ